MAIEAKRERCINTDSAPPSRRTIPSVAITLAVITPPGGIDNRPSATAGSRLNRAIPFD